MIRRFYFQCAAAEASRSIAKDRESVSMLLDCCDTQAMTYIERSRTISILQLKVQCALSNIRPNPFYTGSACVTWLWYFGYAFA